MSFLRRSEPIILILCICVFISVGAYFGTINEIKTARNTLTGWVSVITSMAVGIGAINVGRIHGKNILTKKPTQWYLSALLLIMLVSTFSIGLYFKVSSSIFQSWYNTFFVPNDTMISAIIGWMLIPATYRAFRMRSLESSILLVCGVIVMLMNVPVGEVIWSGIPEIGRWITNIPNVAGQRAFIIVVAIGIIVLTLRTMLGYEKGALAAGGSE
jgi:hypothetical protein